MLVIGLHGWFLHPIAILLCDMVVYSEFLIHPILLLSTSTKLRQEIKQTLQRLCQDTISFANGGQTDFCIKVPRLSWNFALLTNWLPSFKGKIREKLGALGFKKLKMTCKMKCPIIGKTDCKVTKMQSEQKVHVSFSLVRHLNSRCTLHNSLFMRGSYDIKKLIFA